MTSIAAHVGRLAVGGTNNPYVESLVAVRTEALTLMEHYGLTERGWHFQFSNHKLILGQCVHDHKLIKFSQHYALKSTQESITDTLLHEIAHALIGPFHGHDETWQRKAIELGADPYAKCQGGSVSTARYNYRLECPECGSKAYRYRLKRVMHRAVCPDCDVPIKIYKINGR